MENVIRAASLFKAKACVVLAPNHETSTYLDDMEITVSRAPNSFAKEGQKNGNWYKPDRGTWGSFREKLMDEPRIAPDEDKKRCSVFVGGQLAGKSREAKAVKTVEVFGIDIDSGGTVEASVKWLRDAGLEGVVVPTISYGKSRTLVRIDDYKKWAEKNGFPLDHTPGSVKAYLNDKGIILPDVLETATVLATDFTPEGLVIPVSHPPLEKHRIFLPLAHVVIVKDYVKGRVSQKDVADAYSTAYLAAAATSGLAFDKACATIERMWYAPYVYVAEDLRRRPLATHVRGRAFDFVPHFEAALAAQTSPSEKTPTPVKAKVTSPLSIVKEQKSFVHEGIDLVRWAANARKTFKLASVLQERGVAPILGDREKGGIFIECPHEAEHTAPSPQRTYVIDADPDEGSSFVFHCSGNACSCRDDLEQIGAMLEKGWIAVEDLDAAPSKTDVENEVNSLTDKSSEKDVREVLAKVQAIDDSFFAERMDKKIGKIIGLTAAQIKKQRTSPSKKSRDVDVFYPEENDFKDDTDKLKARFLAENGNEKRCFRMGIGNVRIDTESRSTQTLTANVLRHELNRIAKFQKIVGTGDGIAFKNISCPHDYVSDIFHADDLNLPELVKVADVPFFDSQGTLVTNAGYHEGSKTYYLPDASLILPPVSVDPTRDEVAKAKALLLDDAFVDFPFSGEFSKAHTLAMVLLPAARALIDGPTPFHVIDKTGPGTGGGYLMDTFSGIVFGTPCPMTTEKGDPDENRKSITTAGLNGLGVYCIDNLHHTLSDKTLASALTSGFYADRMLGTNVQVKVKINWVWAAVGNGVSLTEEIARRSIFIKLDSGLENPISRPPESFKHFPLATWVKENRGDLVWAVLTLIQAWISAGKPLPRHNRVLPSFENWSRVMGGILETVGVDGFLTDRDIVNESAVDATAAFKRFVALWWKEFGDVPVSVGTLAYDAFPTMGESGDLVALLLKHQAGFPEFDFMTRAKTSWGPNLAKEVGKHRGRVFKVGDTKVRLVRDRDSKNNKWALVIVGDAESIVAGTHV